MRKLQVAVIGLGRLGRTCANALIDEQRITLAGVVRRTESLGPMPGRLERVPVVSHVRDLPEVDVALVCVPPHIALGVARELLQARIPIAECANLEGRSLETHYAELDHMAKDCHVSAVLGAGWDPGVMPLLADTFEMLIPHGHSDFHRHPGVGLHHSAAISHIQGVKDALVGEFRGSGGIFQRYAYVVVDHGADFALVQAAIANDPLFAGEETRVFQVDDLSEIEAEEGQGMMLERRSVGATGVRESLLLEARFEPAAFAARVMIDAARRIPALPHGAHRYALTMHVP